MMLDPAVHELSKAFANRKPEAVVRNFDIIKTIFSDEHAANYSAETRLTAIALLYHIMRSTMHGASEPVQQLVGLLKSDAVSLFCYETELVKKIFPQAQ
jgi:hypothetical protein